MVGTTSTSILPPTPDDVGKLHQRVVLEAGVEDLAVDLLVRLLQQEQIDIRHVLDVDVGPFLRAAQHLDAAGVNRLVGEDVDDDVEPLARSVAAHRGGPHRAGDEARRALFCEHLSRISP